MLLPRLLDAIMQVLELLSDPDTSDSFGVSAMVLDFAEAFWQVPLHPAERKFFCGKLTMYGTEQFFVFLRMVHGSRSAPLCWARVAALLMCLTRSLFGIHAARALCYVDDPLFLFAGSPDQRKRMACICILTWEALGFGLQFKKGQYGAAVERIVGSFVIGSTGITARVAPSIVSDIEELIAAFLNKNLVTRKELLSFTGKANRAAGLLFALRPFLQQLYGAIHAGTGSATSGDRIWTKQIRHSLTWLRSFFKEKISGVVRHFEVSEFNGDGDQLEIGTDASPYGLGGWIAKQGQILEFFHDPISHSDAELYKHQICSSEGQQTWECLAILVAARKWEHAITNRRVSLRVRGDNVGALTLVVKLRPSSAQQAIVARELALVCSKASFPPAVLHTPGIAHKIADMLFRVDAPGGKPTDHPALKHATRVSVETRNRSWYRALLER